MRVPVLVKVAVFALVVMGAYTYYANSIPQLRSEPPEELSLEGGNVTPEQLVKAGEGIFKGKGTCEICHQLGPKGARGPHLAGGGAKAPGGPQGRPGVLFGQGCMHRLPQGRGRRRFARRPRPLPDCQDSD